MKRKMNSSNRRGYEADLDALDSAIEGIGRELTAPQTEVQRVRAKLAHERAIIARTRKVQAARDRAHLARMAVDLAEALAREAEDALARLEHGEALPF